MCVYAEFRNRGEIYNTPEIRLVVRINCHVTGATDVMEQTRTGIRLGVLVVVVRVPGVVSVVVGAGEEMVTGADDNVTQCDFNAENGE